jgi:hypothetical protein
MLRASGDSAASGRGSCVRADILVFGDSPAAWVAAAVLRRSAPQARVVVVDAGTPSPEPLAMLSYGLELGKAAGLDPVDSPAALREHAIGMGVERIAGPAEPVRDGERIERLVLPGGGHAEATWYVDATAGPAPRVTGPNWLRCGTDASLGPTLACLGGHMAACTLAAIAQNKAGQGAFLDRYAGAWREQLDVHQRIVGVRNALHEAPSNADTFERAWNDIASGGFAPAEPSRAMVGVYGVGELHAMLSHVAPGPPRPLAMQGVNVVKPQLFGATHDSMAEFRGGSVRSLACLRRDGHILCLAGVFAALIEALKRQTVVADVLAEIRRPTGDAGSQPAPYSVLEAIEGLEYMLRAGWLLGRMDKRRPLGDWSAWLSGSLRPKGTDDRTRRGPETVVVPAIRSPTAESRSVDRLNG